MEREIKDSETLARALYSPSFFDQGRLSPIAYTLMTLPSGKEKGLSVLRKDFPEFNHDLEYLKSLRPRKEGDSYVCCGFLLAKEVRGINIKSKKKINIDIISSSSYSRKMKTHSEIIFKIEGETVLAGDESIEYKSYCRKLTDLTKYDVENIDDNYQAEP
jgi:hypothetical protein